MTLEFHGANELEEQDIGLFYSLPSSCTVSDTETSSAFIPSRQTSQVHLELPSRHAFTFLKSTSMSDVVEAQQIQPVLHQRTLARSNTLPRRVQNASWHGSTDTTAFDFPDGKVLNMRQWMLGFVVGESSVFPCPSSKENNYMQSTSILILVPLYGLCIPPCIYRLLKKRICLLHRYLRCLNELIYSQSAFSAFPDSLQFDQGTEVHSFRIRVYPSSSNEPCGGTLKPPEPLDGFMYGYSYFSQTRDSSSKRGYKQVMEFLSYLKGSTTESEIQLSLVLLAYHQYPALFTNVVSKLGPFFQTHGITILETACHNIANWCAKKDY